MSTEAVLARASLLVGGLRGALVFYPKCQYPLATGECGTDVCPKADCPRPLHNQWARVFTAGRRGLRAGTAQSALTVILKLEIGRASCRERV